MTDGELATAIIGGIVTVSGGGFALVRWLGTLWRDVRREEIAAQREAAAAAREASARTSEIMLEQVAATATLAAKIDHIPSRFAELLWREHTPVEGIPLAGIRDEQSRRQTTNSDPPSERRRMQALEQQPISRFPGDRPPGRPPGRRND